MPTGGAERCLLGHVEQRCRGRSLLRNDAERWRLGTHRYRGSRLAICNYTQGFGDQTQVIGSPTTTTVYPASTVAFLPEDGGDLMLSTAQGYVTFRSSSPSWNWAAIANGTINSVSLVDFGVELSVNGGAFESLQSPGVSPPLNGPAMLGGITAGGELSPFIGLGGSWINTSSKTTNACSMHRIKGSMPAMCFPSALEHPRAIVPPDPTPSSTNAQANQALWRSARTVSRTATSSLATRLQPLSGLSSRLSLNHIAMVERQL